MELLIALTIVALLGALAGAAPASSLAARWRSREGGAAVLGILRKARWLSISEGREYGVVFDRPDPAGPWRAFLQRKDAGDWMPAEAPVSLPAVVTGLAMTGPARKEFNPDGTSGGGSDILTCRGGAAYRISLTTATGRIRLYREGA